MNAAQAYVTLSRGRERGMIFTDLSKDELIKALSRERRRKSAVELVGPPRAARVRRPRERMRRFHGTRALGLAAGAEASGRHGERFSHGNGRRPMDVDGGRV